MKSKSKISHETAGVHKNKTTPIPFPPRTFMIGNLPQIAGAGSIDKMLQLGYDYGPIFELKILNKRFVFCTNFEYCKELMDEDLFEKYLDLPGEHVSKIIGDGLFTANTGDPNWHKAHNILTPGFAMRSVQGYVPTMQDSCNKLMEKWSKIPEGDSVNLMDEMTRLTLEVIGLCGFDYSFGCFENEERHTFIEAIIYLLDEAVQRGRIPQFLIPLRFRRNQKFNKYLDYANDLIDNIISKRKENPEEYASKFDLLSLMLNARDKESGEKLSDENIRYQIITFLVAGHETTSGLLAFAFYYLMTNPEWLEKVYEEVDRVLGADENPVMTAKKISQCKLIKRALLETLRLQPPIPIINVTPKKDTTIGKENYPMKTGTSCLIWPHHLHRDKKIWGEDAETFNPDNFLPSKVAARDKNAFKAFGNGSRACIGRQFAMTEAIMAMAMILQKYKLTLPKDYKFGYEETYILKPKNLNVKLTLRTNEDRFHLKSVVEEENVVIKQLNLQKHNTPMHILYGSNMGSSKDLAHRIGADAKANGFNTSVAPMDCFSKGLPTEGLVQIVTSTYNGIAPDNAIKFDTYLKECKDDLSGIKYSVFGCGNTQWDTYQLFPSFVDRSLKRFGAERIYQKGAADASGDFDSDFEKWYDGYWDAIIEKLDLGKSKPSSNFQILNQVTDYKPISNGKYNNDEGTVSKVAERFQVNLSDFVIIKNKPAVKIEELLRFNANLKSLASKEQLEQLIKATACPPEKMKLQQYLNLYDTEVEAKQKTVWQLIDEFPSCQLDLETFLDIILD